MTIYVRLEENHQMPSYESSAGLFGHPVFADPKMKLEGEELETVEESP
jgi:hypothetical protein